MSERRTWRLAVGLGMALGWLGWAQEARAGNPAILNIDVTITQNLSVAVLTAGNTSSTQTVALLLSGGPNQFLVGPSTGAAIINDSGGSTERWQLNTNAKAMDGGGGGQQWTLVLSTSPLSTVGPEDFALQAVFGSSNTTTSGTCPVGASADWGGTYAQPITTSLVTYTAATFADPNLTAGGGTPNPDAAAPNPGEMDASSFRALCWRVISPQSTAFTHMQVIQVIVTAVGP